MSELSGICAKCGAGYDGWALANLTAQKKCSRCGSDLKITQNGIPITTGYSSIMVGTYKTVPNYKRRFGGGGTIIN
jgi:uncharacterized protein (DUF983 family)